MELQENVKTRYNAMSLHLNEKQRRYLLATEAKLIGRGGIKIVSLATGVCRQTIIDGIKELNDPQQFVNTKIRRSGAGRPKKEKDYPGLKCTPLSRPF